jgi:hypothetical protein
LPHRVNSSGGGQGVNRHGRLSGNAKQVRRITEQESKP